MRLLHTSDWHLGHTFGGQSRAAEHDAFLDWLLDTIEQHEVDALVVAGDVFDSPSSPNDAFERYYRFLARLEQLGGKTRSGGRRTAVIVGGNHDSAGRLDAPRDVLSALSTHVVGGYDASRTGSPAADPTGLLVPLAGAGGQVGVVVAAVPFLNDWRIGVRGFDADPREQLASMHDRFREVYSRLADKAEAAYPGIPLVATGHLTCLAKAGDPVSEDDAVPAEINRVGTLGAMGPGIFDPRYSYVALGHIHRGFSVDPAGRVRYSGTPVQVSAVEPPEARRVLLVDVDAQGTTVTPIPVPCRRRLLSITGSLDEVRTRLSALRVPVGELPPFVTIRALLDAPEPRAVEWIRDSAQKNTVCAPLLAEVQTQLRPPPPPPEPDGTTVGPGPVTTLPAGAEITPELAFLFAYRAKFGKDAQPTLAVWQRFHSLVEGVDGGAR